MTASASSRNSGDHPHAIRIPPGPGKIGSVSIHRRAERTFLDCGKAHLVASLILLQASISPLALEYACIAVCRPQKFEFFCLWRRKAESRLPLLLLLWRFPFHIPSLLREANRSCCCPIAGVPVSFV